MYTTQVINRPTIHYHCTQAYIRTQAQQRPIHLTSRYNSADTRRSPDAESLTSGSYLVFVANGEHPANTTRWNNDVLMLPQRLRRWPNIKTSLFQRVVFGRPSCNKSLVCEKVVRPWPVRLLRP